MAQFTHPCLLTSTSSIEEDKIQIGGIEEKIDDAIYIIEQIQKYVNGFGWNGEQTFSGWLWEKYHIDC